MSTVQTKIECWLQRDYRHELWQMFKDAYKNIPAIFPLKLHNVIIIIIAVIKY